jgi:glycosyltransferase involved in cell wall biosynthesis
MATATEFRVAAVIPAHDGMPDVIEAVASALEQSLAPAEVVVVDDDSGDGTGDAVERRYGDRVRVVRGRFGSAAAARNAGWRAARSPWVAFLDADDLWFPDKLETAGAALAAAPRALWFFSDGAFRTLEGVLEPSWLAHYAVLDPHYLGSPLAELFEVNFVLTSSVIVRRDAIDALDGFREDMTHAEDLDLWIRLARRGPAAGSSRALVRYQHRVGGLTRQLEARLTGNAILFRRLADDGTLPAGLRRRARRRAALAHYKLAIAAMREGRADECRRWLKLAWIFPERAVAVSAAWAASLLPSGWRAGLRRQRWAREGIAAPLGRQRRVVLRSSREAEKPA